MHNISLELLKRLAISEKINDTTYHTMIKNILCDQTAQNHRPEPYGQFDPRTQNRILYSKRRSLRPHSARNAKKKKKDCPICMGNTTRIWDIAPLTKGHTFINENLFPITFPSPNRHWPLVVKQKPCYEKGLPSFGLHLLLWHSSYHDQDLHNMPIEDICVNLERLAALEKFLLTQPSPMPVSSKEQGIPMRGYIALIKNYGAMVGGSLEHGHMQIVHTNTLPARTHQDMEFLKNHRQSFAEVLNQNIREELIIRKYQNDSVILATPFCLKRPLEAIIYPKDTNKNYLYQLSASEIKGIATALHQSTKALHTIMPSWGKETSYNLIFHQGAIGGLYIEILPWTQALGGYENIGLYLSQVPPEESTICYRENI